MPRRPSAIAALMSRSLSSMAGSLGKRHALYRATWPDATTAELRQALLDDVEPVAAFAGTSVTGGRLSIASLAEGEIWAVADKEISLDGVTATTDDRGGAQFDLGTAATLGELALSPSLDLGDGRYVLTVQLHRDGDLLGREFAAPLLVGSAAIAGPVDDGAPDGSDSGSDGSSDGSGGSGSDGSGGGSGDGGSDSGDSSGPGDSGSGSPGTGGGSGNGSGDSGEEAGGGSPDEGAGDDGGEISYPGVRPFLITSISPARVGVAGGTLVTITGNALPIDPTVRIGDSATATVVRSSVTELSFRAPARIADSYDVNVFARDGREWTLEDALTYVPDAPAGSDEGSGGDSGGSNGGSGGSGGGTDDPGDGSDGDSGSGSGGSATTGPSGEPLVRTSKFAAVGSLWSMDCSVSCTGVAI